MKSKEYFKIRKRLGMTQRELAERLGVVIPTVSRRENGDIPISKEAGMAIKLILIETLYNIPEDV